MLASTALVNRSYCNRGLITHGAVTHNAVLQSNSDLWVSTYENTFLGNINLYRSQDKGFSWNSIFRGYWPTGLGWGITNPISATQRANGPFQSLMLFEQLNKVVLFQSFSTGTSYNAWPWVFAMDTGKQSLTETPPTAPDWAVGADDLAIKVTYNENAIYMCYILGGRFDIRTFHPNLITIHVNDTTTAGSNYTTTFDAAARRTGEVDIVVADTNEKVQYIRYDNLTQTYTTPIQIASNTGTTNDLCIQQDGHNVLLATWSSSTSNSIKLFYSYSADNGRTWFTSTIPTAPTAYMDKVLNKPAGRISNMAGLDGFFITYVQLDPNIPKTYMRRFQGLVLQEPHEIGNLSNLSDSIVGAHFFRSPVARRVDINDPEAINIAYQVGEGNNNLGVDTVSVRFGQESLAESAYPSNIEPITSPPDQPNQLQRAVSINVLSGPSTNVDYYAAGAVGNVTNKYLSFFNKIGTQVVVKNYEPTLAAETNDQAAFGMANEIMVPVLIQPLTYASPLGFRTEEYSSFVERDTRGVWLPPNLHLDRNLVLNAGNYLKRTIWTMLFDGNEYELSQVVPYFINGEITHYTVNAYVIGPSNNPFARVTLPSET